MERKMKVREAIKLYNELNLFLEESFNHCKKYHIEIFIDKIYSFVEPAEKVRKSLIGKYGDVMLTPLTLEDGSINQNVENFWNDYNPVLDEEITIDCSCKEISLELLDSLSSNNRYKMIYLYIIKK